MFKLSSLKQGPHRLFIFFFKLLIQEDYSQRISNVIVKATHFRNTFFPDVCLARASHNHPVIVVESPTVFFTKMGSQLNNYLPHHVICKNPDKRIGEKSLELRPK